MKCAKCNLYWADEGEKFPSCKADPNWPAPCEYDDEPIEKEKHWSCSECIHVGQETTDDVACCNCCEDGSFFEEDRDEYTLEDLGNNWW
jgi:hypothetical protein